MSLQRFVQVEISLSFTSLRILEIIEIGPFQLRAICRLPTYRSARQEGEKNKQKKTCLDYSNVGESPPPPTPFYLMPLCPLCIFVILMMTYIHPPPSPGMTQTYGFPNNRSFYLLNPQWLKRHTRMHTHLPLSNKRKTLFT